MTHPVEHLAEYVDGTLPAGARAEVDTHLDSCPECRADVELAGRARSVLRDAPEVEVPFGTVRPGTGRGGRSRERDRFRRTAWAGGFAAAASIAAILTLVVLSGGGGTGDDLAANAPAPLPTSVQTEHVNYDAAGIDRLAARIARRVVAQRHDVQPLAPPTGLDTAGGTGSGGSSETAPTVRKSSPFSGDDTTTTDTSGGGGGSAGGGTGYSTEASTAPTPRACLRQGAGLTRSAKPVAVIQAMFEGRPVYIGAYVRDGDSPERLVLWVVSTDTCELVTTAAHPLA